MSDLPHVDFDLHGVVGIRVLHATPADVATVRRQLGPLESPLERPPDITVRFVDRIDDDRPLTYATWPEGASTGDDFYLLRGRDGRAARTSLPFCDVGARCDIVCERRAGLVPHLLAVVNLTALAAGVLPLHASAFVHRGVGVMATGWAKGGKTETLLAFAARGASYVGDEWVYLLPDGTMRGVPEPIRLWHWHVEQITDLAAGLGAGARARLAALPAAARLAAGTARRLPAAGLLSSVLRRAEPVVRRQAYVHVTPERLFGSSAVVLCGRLDVVLLLVSGDQPEVTVTPVSGAEVASRMLASLEEERAPFMAAYRQYRFAFPDRRSPVVEQAAELERVLLDRVLGGRTAHQVTHPYPVRLRDLVGPVESVLPDPLIT